MGEVLQPQDVGEEMRARVHKLLYLYRQFTNGWIFFQELDIMLRTKFLQKRLGILL